MVKGRFSKHRYLALTIIIVFLSLNFVVRDYFISEAQFSYVPEVDDQAPATLEYCVIKDGRMYKTSPGEGSRLKYREVLRLVKSQEGSVPLLRDHSSCQGKIREGWIKVAVLEPSPSRIVSTSLEYGVDHFSLTPSELTLLNRSGLPSEISNALYAAVRLREQQQGWRYDYHIHVSEGVGINKRGFVEFLTFLGKWQPAVASPAPVGTALPRVNLPRSPYSTGHIAPGFVAYHHEVIEELWPLDVGMDISCRTTSYWMQNVKATMLYRNHVLVHPEVRITRATVEDEDGPDVLKACQRAYCRGSSRVVASLPARLAPCFRPHPIMGAHGPVREMTASERDVERAIGSIVARAESHWQGSPTDDECSQLGEEWCVFGEAKVKNVQYAKYEAESCSPPKWYTPHGRPRDWPLKSSASHTAKDICLFTVDNRDLGASPNQTFSKMAELERAATHTLAWIVNRFYAGTNKHPFERLGYQKRLLEDRDFEWARVATAMDIMGTQPMCAYVAHVAPDLIFDTRSPPLDTITRNSPAAEMFFQTGSKDFFIVRNTPGGLALMREWWRAHSVFPSMSISDLFDNHVFPRNQEKCAVLTATDAVPKALPDYHPWNGEEERWRMLLSIVDTFLPAHPASPFRRQEAAMGASRVPVPPLSPPSRRLAVSKGCEEACPAVVDLSLVIVSAPHLHQKLATTLANLAAFDWQAHGTSAELVVVSWAPPDEMPPLDLQLAIPDSRMLSIRFLEVPAAIHNKLNNKSEELPLHHAWNVGFRRARGSWVVTADGDTLFPYPTLATIAKRVGKGSRALYSIPRFPITPETTPHPTSQKECRLPASPVPFDLSQHGEILLAPASVISQLRGFAEAGSASPGTDLLCEAKKAGIQVALLADRSCGVFHTDPMLPEYSSCRYGIARENCWGLCDIELDEVVYETTLDPTLPRKDDGRDGITLVPIGEVGEVTSFVEVLGDNGALNNGLIIKAWLNGGNNHTASRGVSEYRVVGGNLRVLDTEEYDLIVVTPTYPNAKQRYRLCFTGTHFARDGRVLWIVSDDTVEPQRDTISLLESGVKVRYVYLYGDGRGHFGHVQRRLALELIKKFRLRGTVYMADDDNYYNQRILASLRRKKKGRIGYHAIGMKFNQREGPVFHDNGTFSWVGGWTERTYPVDMGSFSYDAELLWDKPEPLYTHYGFGGETQFLERTLGLSHRITKDGRHRFPDIFQCLPDNRCTWYFPLVVHNGELHPAHLRQGAPVCHRLLKEYKTTEAKKRRKEAAKEF